MRKSVHHRMLLGSGGGFAANPDGPLLVEFCKTTNIPIATLLANDVIPNGATVISVSPMAPNAAAVGGTATLIGPNVQWVDDGLNALTPASFQYTIQDNVTFQLSTATVTLQPFFATTACVDDGPGGAFIATEFHPLILSKFGGGSITANDTFGGAAPANPVTVTVLTPDTPPYATLFDSSTPGIYTLIIPPGINQIEIECWGAEGGLGGSLSAPGAAGPGQPNQAAGRGAHRLVSNLSVTPGQILSIAVGGEGVDALTTTGTGSGGNIGTGAAGGPGFADNSTSPTGPGGGGQLDSFGFPDGAGVSASGGSGLCTGCDGVGGAFGSDAFVDHTTGAGGGGGAGSAVTMGDATTSSGVPFNRLGPVLNCAGGGGGGAGARVAADLSRDAGQDGGPPAIDREPASSFFGSHGDTVAGAGATGGGGGGFRGGDSNPAVDPLTGKRRGFGGESNDERYKEAGERTPGPKTPSIQLGAQEIWPAFSGSTTTEFASLQVGNGRVRIQGRTVVDQLGGTQFPIHCQVVDLGATVQVTPDIPFNPSGTNECSFFYFLTDTKTGQTSSVCQVRMDIIANFVSAVADGPFGVTESVNNDIAIATLESNDTVPGIPVFALVPSSDVNLNSFTIVGPNVRVNPVDRSVSTTASFDYSITDPLMPVGFELLPNRKTDIATVNLTINLPIPVANPDGPGGLPTPIEDLGQSPPTVNVPTATLLTNDVCGSLSCTFDSIINPIRCTAVLVGANVVVTSTAPISAGSTCSFQYRVVNAQGVFSNFATVTLDVLSVSFDAPLVNTGFHAGIPSATRGNIAVPVGKTLMKTEVWGAAGGAGNGGVGAAGHGLKRESVSVVIAGQNIEFACGQRGTDGGAVSPIFGASNGAGGGIDISGVGGGANIADGFTVNVSCPLVSPDGGTAVGGTNTCVGGGGSSGQINVFGGGGGGGAGSVVWFGSVVANNIINCSSGGGGGGHTASGFGGGTSGSACGGQGRDMNTPVPPPTAGFGRGGGGGGLVGGDTSYILNNAGGPGGGSGGDVGNFLPASIIETTEPTTSPGRITISFA